MSDLEDVTAAEPVAVEETEQPPTGDDTGHDEDTAEDTGGQ